MKLWFYNLRVAFSMHHVAVANFRCHNRGKRQHNIPLKRKNTKIHTELKYMYLYACIQYYIMRRNMSFAWHKFTATLWISNCWLVKLYKVNVCVCMFSSYIIFNLAKAFCLDVTLFVWLSLILTNPCRQFK